MTDIDPQLTPEQDKVIGRVQIAAALLILGLMVTLRVLANSHIIELWAMAAIGLPAVIAILLAVALTVSHVEGRSFREVMARTSRRSLLDLKQCPARLRRRLSKVVGRSRSR